MKSFTEVSYHFPSMHNDSKDDLQPAITTKIGKAKKIKTPRRGRIIPKGTWRDRKTD